MKTAALTGGLIIVISVFFGGLYCAGAKCDGWATVGPSALFLSLIALIALAMWRCSPTDSGNPNPEGTG